MPRAKMHLHLKKGALHKALGVAQGKHIPESMLAQAKHSRNQHMRKMATLAENMRHWKHGIKHAK